MTPAKSKPSDLELQVLSVLWERGPSTVRSVLAALPDGKARAYTTVLTVMQVMEKKGLLTHTRAGMAHVYKPTIDRRRVAGPLLRGLVQRVFGGSPAAAVQQLLRETDVSEDELAKMRSLLRDHEQPKRRG
jgi:BlaI family transcriptional regulator, penicillinase repressor